MTAARATVTVASYNIHKARGLDGREDLARIADVIREIGPDAVGVQEVFLPQAETLAHRLGMGLVMGAIGTRKTRPYGNAVLTRLAVRGTVPFDLTRLAREPRGGIRVDLSLHGHMLHLFNVHFGLGLRERAEQVELLVRRHIMTDRRRGPRILMGDLNEWFPGPVGRTLRREFHAGRLRRTHPSPLPLFPLDRIYWDRDLDGDRFHVHTSRLARVASDHLPVVAHLRVPVHVRSHP